MTHTSTVPARQPARTGRLRSHGRWARLRRTWIGPALVAPSFILLAVFVYGFIGFTVFISLTRRWNPFNRDTALRAASRVSFDRLDSDGCMSTNDTVTVLASGASGITPSLPDFTEALTQLCTDLAKQLLRDAEGADHDIAITTLNAANEEDAVEVGRSVARSNLFKAAVFGKDPNWGRVLASIGTTQAAFDPADLDVAMNGVWVCKESTPHADPATVDLEPREVSVTIDLKAGSERATVWTNDLTHAYVHENSAYSS